MRVSDGAGARPPSLWQLSDAWLRRAAEVIGASAEALNALNVFPVSDSDTGANLKLTLQGVADAVPRLDRASLDDVVQAVVLAAHGNSGAIVAEMVTSLCRALERGPRPLAGRAGPPGLLAVPPGLMVAALLRTVADGAWQAVAEPVTGTILTVADEAAAAAGKAAADHAGDALAVARAAQAAAREALARTTDQLPVLQRAGVVDAGAQAYVLLIDVLVEVLGGETAQPLTRIQLPRTPPPPMAPPAQVYEVMYALRGVPPERLDALRRELSALGTSVVVVGDATVAQVHVHLLDAGAAVEAGLGLGEMSRVRVTALGPAGEQQAGPAGRTVLSVVAGPGLADAVRALGGVPVVPAAGRVTLAELAEAIGRRPGDLVVLPNDPETLALARRLAAAPGGEDRRLAVIPTVAQVQGLTALAVHEPTADFAAAVVSMSSAAGHTRHGAVTVAETSAITMAGPCRPGEVLGLVEGDVAELGDSVLEVGWRVVERLLPAGGQLLTLIGGAGVGRDLLEALRDRAVRADQTLEVELIDGGQPRYRVLVGLE